MKARRAEAALQRVMLAEGFLQRRQVGVVGQALDGGDRRAFGLHARMRQERTASPSTSTVQAPQTPCSQPMWVPVRRSSWRKQSGEREPGLDIDADLFAVDFEFGGHVPTSPPRL
jgi:hypothetical protein